MEDNYSAYTLIKDRKDAIEAALKMAEPDDYVLFMGKGEEDFIKLNGNEKTPWNEKGAIREILGKL